MEHQEGGSPANLGTSRKRWLLLTLRDYFAAEALTGIMVLIANDKHDPRDFSQRNPEDKLAADAYRLADAMLKERAK